MELSQASKTSAQLAAENPVVPWGSLMVESDTGFAKLGDGSTRWNALSYWRPFPPEPAVEAEPEA